MGLGLNDDLRLLLYNDSGSPRANVGDVFVVEDGSDHQMSGLHPLEMKRNSHFTRSSLAEEPKSHVGVSERLAANHILVSYLDPDVLGELLKLLNWDLHVLHVPLGVLTAVDAHVGAPLLSVADFDVNEGVLFVKGTATVDIQVRILHMQAQETLGGHYEAHGGHRLHNRWLRLHVYLGLGLNDDLCLRLDVDDIHAAHANEFGAHVDEASSVELYALLAGSLGSEHT